MKSYNAQFWGNPGDSGEEGISNFGEINGYQGIVPALGEFFPSLIRNSYLGSGEQNLRLPNLEELGANLKPSHLSDGNINNGGSSDALIRRVGNFISFVNGETSQQQNSSMGNTVETTINSSSGNNREPEPSTNENELPSVESLGNSQTVLASSSNEPNNNTNYSNTSNPTRAEAFQYGSNSSTPGENDNVLWENQVDNSLDSQPTQPQQHSSESNLDLSGLVEGTDYARSQVIVKFGEGASSTEISALQQSLGARVLETTKTLGTQLWTIQNGMSIEQVIAILGESNGVEYAEPNYLLSANFIPNDTEFDQLWGLDNTGQTGGTADADIDAPEAWDLTTGNGQVVGVIDSGVDYTHPDLINNMWINPGEIAGNGIDDDGNGYIDDVHGYDFVNNDGDPMDDHSHGTHVAGTIAAEGDNTLGVIGVAPNTQIMALKFLDAQGFGSTFDAIQAIEYATMMKQDYGVNINLTNNSWGGGGFSQALYDAIAAAGAAGQLFVAAAGNDGFDTDSTPHYPSNYDLDNIISVAATDHNDQLAGFSNFGATSVDLGAPGVNILSTVPGGGYDSFNGTSMAAPHVSGVAALLWSQDSQLNALEVKEQILNYADPIQALQGNTVTGGRLNAYNSLTQTQPPPGELNGTIWHDLDGDGVQDAGEPGLESWTVYLDQNQNGNFDIDELSTLTDINGDYSFLNLVPGTYTVAEVLPPGWEQTYPGLNGSFETGNFSSWQTIGDTTIETAGFGSSPTEGTYQALLTNDGDSVTDTDLETFLGLTLGSLDGLGNGDATQGTAIKQTVTVSAGTQLNFDWNFLTNEGTPGDPYNDFSFVSIVSNNLDTLADTNSSFVSSATSFNEETGFSSFSYTFSTAGTYTIGVGVVDVQDTGVSSALLVDNFSFIGDVSTGSGNQTVFVGSGDTVTNIDFGNQEVTNVLPGEIHGSKWNDINGDGIWDADELGLEGWTIYLDQNNNGELDNGELSTVTDANGNYSFFNLAPDTYTVAEVLIPGWEQTFPGDSGGNETTIIDFESLEHEDASIAFHGFSYEEDGFVLDNLSNLFEFATFGTLESRFSGSTALFNDTVNGITRLTSLDGQPFDLMSIDLTELNGPNVADVTFTGELSGGGTVTQTFTLDGISFDPETFIFSGFNDVIAVEWSQASPFHQFDNITISTDQDSIPGTHTVELDPGEIVTDIDFGNQQISPSTIFGTPGPDELNIFDSPVIVFAGDSNDVVDGSQSPGGNRYYGGDGDDIIWASVYDRLFGEEGNDTLFAGDGNSILHGGAGTDQFWIALATLPSAANTIADFEEGVDVIGIGGLGITFGDLSITQNGDDALISALGTDLAILTGIQATALDSTSFVFA